MLSRVHTDVALVAAAGPNDVSRSAAACGGPLGVPDDGRKRRDAPARRRRRARRGWRTRAERWACSCSSRRGARREHGGDVARRCDRPRGGRERAAHVGGGRRPSRAAMQRQVHAICMQRGVGNAGAQECSVAWHTPAVSWLCAVVSLYPPHTQPVEAATVDWTRLDDPATTRCTTCEGRRGRGRSGTAPRGVSQVPKPTDPNRAPDVGTTYRPRPCIERGTPEERGQPPLATGLA